jgi:hypothetical protein
MAWSTTQTTNVGKSTCDNLTSFLGAGPQASTLKIQCVKSKALILRTHGKRSLNSVQHHHHSKWTPRYGLFFPRCTHIPLSTTLQRRTAWSYSFMGVLMSCPTRPSSTTADLFIADDGTACRHVVGVQSGVVFVRSGQSPHRDGGPLFSTAEPRLGMK